MDMRTAPKEKGEVEQPVYSSSRESKEKKTNLINDETFRLRDVRSRNKKKEERQKGRK
jgi:hypothetical protein